MSSFLSRILVVVVSLPIVLYLVWLGGWWITGLALVAALLALHELYVMGRSLRPLVLAGYTGAVLTLVGAEAGGYPWMIGGALATLPLAFALYGIAETRQSATVALGTTVLGVVWIPLALGHIVLLRDIPEHGRLAVFTVLLAVFADSTFAYFVGRLIGRHRLAPTISPGKSVEGFIAGTIAAVAVCFFALYEERDTFLTIWQSLVFGAIVAAAEPIGDLFESAIKRDLQVKDSGRLLAGHGGVLDRIDSLLFAGPAALYAILAFGYGGPA
jgi:phosphatidate cytidylyltransferase